MNENRYLEEDFSDFLQELIDGDRFNDTKENGIAKLTIDKGYEHLSNAQKHVLKNAISHYVCEECVRGCEIPWTEMSTTEFNGGMCGSCHHTWQKMEKE